MLSADPRIPAADLTLRHRSALIFPGIPHLPGDRPGPLLRRRPFHARQPFTRKLTVATDEVLGYSLTDRFAGSEDGYPVDAQVAFMVNCVALARWSSGGAGRRRRLLRRAELRREAAAAWTGALPFPDAVRMTAELARMTKDYFRREYQDAVTQSFVRTPASTLQEILAEMDERGEWYDISCHIDVKEG